MGIFVLGMDLELFYWLFKAVTEKPVQLYHTSIFFIFSWFSVFVVVTVWYANRQDLYYPQNMWIDCTMGGRGVEDGGGGYDERPCCFVQWFS